MYEESKRDKTRINCDCGGFYQQKYKRVHEATKMHQKYLLNTLQAADYRHDD